jgi:hypothetical protein
MTKGKKSSTVNKKAIVNKILSDPRIQEEINDVFSTCEDNDETKSTIVHFMFNGNDQYQWFHTGEFEFDETFYLFGEHTTDIKIIELKTISPINLR